MSLRPQFFPTLDPLGDLGPEGLWTKREPLALDLVEQEAPVGRAELHQPVQRLLLRLLADRHDHVDRQAAPGEIRREHDHVRLVGTHPTRQRARADQPAADELATRIDRPLGIDRTAMIGAKRTWMARAHGRPAHLDLQPSITAGGAAAATSRDRGFDHFACARVGHMFWQLMLATIVLLIRCHYTECRN